MEDYDTYNDLHNFDSEMMNDMRVQHLNMLKENFKREVAKDIILEAMNNDKDIDINQKLNDEFLLYISNKVDYYN